MPKWVTTQLDRLSGLINCGITRPEDNASARSSQLDFQSQDYQPKVEINWLPGDDGAIVSVTPPEKPKDCQIADSHVPVDIVLVIDVSGSMNAAAPAPREAGTTNEEREDFNLSVLDLTKHAARTILETMNEGDRLGIVTFSHAANVLQPLTPMTAENKLTTETTINGMKPLTTTNLWAGIMNGLAQFDPLGVDTNRIPALMILTDGMPNHGAPPKGYLARLRELAPLPATIHTFGFGYHIDSCMLRCISEVGSGNYSFIPDAGMIGTVFIHAVAHLQTTFATKCTLEIKTPPAVKLSTISGPFINGQISDDETFKADTLQNILRLDLGDLQYGQSRDIYLELQNRSGHKTTFERSLWANKSGLKDTGTKKPVVTASLTFSLTRKTSEVVTTEKGLLSRPRSPQESPMTDSLIRYHKSRAMMCEFLGSFMKPHPFSGYTSISSHDPAVLRAHRERLTEFLEAIPARTQLIKIGSDDEISIPESEGKANKRLLNSLLLDLEGQVSIALSRQEYFTKWALPYFASLSHAHSRQLCNTFKDPGVQQYNQNDFFRKCRDALDEAFDKIEPPVPSRIMPPPSANIRQSNPALNMQSVHIGSRSRDGCLDHNFPAWRGPVRDPSESAGVVVAPPPPYSAEAREGSVLPAYTPARIDMAAYNNSRGSCFAADTIIQLSSNPSEPETATPPARVAISQLRKNDWVLTPHGGRPVRYVVRCPVKNMPMCRIQINDADSSTTPSSSTTSNEDANNDSFLVTPYHPILVQEPTLTTTSDGTWIFPVDAPSTINPNKQELYTGDIYSIMLDWDSLPDAHAILISGSQTSINANSNADGNSPPSTKIWGVTLGHGIHRSETRPDARQHNFFGSYSAVETSLLDVVYAGQPSSSGLEKRKRSFTTDTNQEEDEERFLGTEEAKRRRINNVLRGSGLVTIGGVVRKELNIEDMVEKGSDGKAEKKTEWRVCGFMGPTDMSSGNT